MKKYIKSYEDYDYDPRIDIDIINEGDADYYDGKLFKVILDSTSLYGTTIYVYADCAQTALELAVAYCEKKGWMLLLYEMDEIEPDEEGEYIYVDATTEGASQPYYVSENLHIEEV